MDKKKLQLSEIKVKSLVTLVDQHEQKTAKGGFYHNKPHGSISIHVSGGGSWTEYKTRVAIDSEGTSIGLSPNGNGNNNAIQ